MEIHDNQCEWCSEACGCDSREELRNALDGVVNALGLRLFAEVHPEQSMVMDKDVEMNLFLEAKKLLDPRLRAR
jgi:hypothetical protein